MLKRYFLALLLTIYVYNFAQVPNDNYFYVVSSFWSAGYIFLISFIKTRTSWMIAAIESCALFYIFITAVVHILSPESQWLKSHYGYTMSACYILELAVIIAGASSGLSILSRIRLAFYHMRKSMRGYFYSGEMAI